MDIPTGLMHSLVVGEDIESGGEDAAGDVGGSMTTVMDVGAEASVI